jgi:ketosteroid isomerase-like protein
MNRILAFLAPVAAIAVIAAPAHAETRAEVFQRTLQAHVKAVQDRDMAGLLATITNGESLELLFSNGERKTTRAAYVEFHDQFFREATWSMRFDLLSSIVTDDLAIARMKTRYEETVEGKPYWSESWLTLVFQWEDGGWRLVHDQNTRIRTSNDPAPAA